MFLAQYFPLFFVACYTVAGYKVRRAAAEDPDVVEDPEDLKNLTALPPVARLFGNWDDWESYVPSQDAIKIFPRYRSGYDYDGLVVHVIDFGKFDVRLLATLSEDKKDDFWKAYEQWTRIEERDAALNNGQGIVMLADFDGFSMAHYASSHALQLGLKIFSTMLRQNNAAKYGFIVNVNYSAETWLEFAKPFLGTFLDKFEIYGTLSEKWKSILLKKIPKSQLPPIYGGSKDWKPLPEK